MIHMILYICITYICTQKKLKTFKSKFSYAGVVIGGLTTVAVCAPNHPFQPIHKPLLYAQGIVLIASVASMMLPPTTIIGAAVFSLTVYGGLFVFSGLLICDTQCIIYQAGGFPPLESQQFDPIFR